MSSIESINGNLYIKYYDPRSKYTRRKSLKMKDTQANRRQAQKVAKSYSTNFIPAGFVDADKKYIKFTDAMKEYLAYNNYKPSTVGIYNLAKDHFIAAAGDKFTCEYNNNDYIKLISYFNKKKITRNLKKSSKDQKQLTQDDKKLTQNSRSIYTRALHSFFEYLVKQKYADENPIQVIPYQEKVIESIPPATLEKILNELSENPLQYAFVYLAVHTGLRESTLLDLNWEDIDYKREIIKIRNVKVKGTEFSIPLIPRFRKIFDLLGRKSSGKIFPWKDRHSTKFYRRAQENLKMKKTYGIHKLKHTFISEAIMQGISIEALSELTNTTIRTLKKHYANLDKNYLSRELQKLQIIDSKNDSIMLRSSAG